MIQTDYIEQAMTVFIHIEQDWVRMSDRVRDRLLKDNYKMADYIHNLLTKYKVEPNVISLFNKPKINNDNTDPFKDTMERNAKQKQRKTEERSKANRSVLRSYRIKGK
jgi:hypothetical protein